MRSGRDSAVAVQITPLPGRGAAWPLGAPAAPAAPAALDGGRSRHGRDGTPTGLASLAQVTAEARAALEDAARAAAVAAACALDMAEALDEAVAALEKTGTSTAPTSISVINGSSRVSPREQEVLALVTAGRSNAEIAAALFVSPNTIKTHVASLLNKLHANSRAQLAAIAARQGMAPCEPAPRGPDVSGIASLRQHRRVSNGFTGN